MAKYKKITTPTNPKDYQGGYKDVFYFAPVADFTTIAAPSGSPSAIGDKVKITTAHTFTGTNGFFSYDSKQKVITLTSETVGDPGARLLRHTTTFVVLGDSASTQEQMESLLNDKVICLIKDSKCVAGEYVQLGDDCNQPEFSVAFNGNTTAQGAKEYTVTVAITGSKYFYSGALVESTAV